jgi:hypothetical protein
MISRLPLLFSCIIIATSLLSGSSEGFSSVAQPKNQFGQQIQPQQQLVLSSSTVDDFNKIAKDVATAKKRKRVSASPMSSFGNSNSDEFELNIKPVGIESEFPKRKIKASVRETGTDSMKYYIKSMCNHDLLNKNEEIILAREIQILLKWEAEREKLEEELLR